MYIFRLLWVTFMFVTIVFIASWIDLQATSWLALAVSSTVLTITFMFEDNILKYLFLANHKLPGNGSHIYDEIPGCRWGWGGMANIYLDLKIFNFLNFYNLRAFFPVFSRGLLQQQRAGRNRVNQSHI